MKLKVFSVLNSIRKGKNDSDNFSPDAQRAPIEEEENHKEPAAETSEPKLMRKGSGSFLKLSFAKTRSASSSFEHGAAGIISSRGARSSTPVPISSSSKSTSYSSLTYPDSAGSEPSRPRSNSLSKKNYPVLNGTQAPSVPGNLLDLLNDEAESEKFFQYLQSKYCPESYHFWRAVQSYKALADPNFVRGTLPSTTSTIVFTRSRGNSILSCKLTSSSDTNGDNTLPQSSPQASPISICISASITTASPLVDQITSDRTIAPPDFESPLYKNAIEIYEEFIAPEAKYEINISHTTKQNIQSALIEKTTPLHLPSVFDRALHQVYLLMLYSSFHNYCNSIIEKHNSPPGREVTKIPSSAQSISSTV
eukprot:TRINITY_DN1699_c0_g1_i1.p1 TRINITY_DN1699_c0_g1~~TRINITY_DN1699_c0_g1_i1.p1  ORF type:complete len:365 (-),score=44.97 TRINITY_DN1699_c0_g1_i1:138-1232(-)